jgi:sec-independent protein translocase protein TatC
MKAEEVEPEEGRMTLVEHLTELRDRIIKSLIAIAVGMIIGFVFYPQIFDVLIDPYCKIDQVQQPCRLVIRAPLDGFTIRLKVAAYAGLFLASPVVLWQLWRFVTPGLYARERRYAIPFVVSAVLLFLSGAALAFWTIPKALQFLLTIGGDDLQPLLEPVQYLSFVTFMMLAFGVGFLFPIFLVFLQMAGVLSTQRLRSWRRYAIVLIVVVVAVITPSGDPYSLLALSIPMYVFYEGAIIVGYFINRSRARAETS